MLPVAQGPGYRRAWHGAPSRGAQRGDAQRVAELLRRAAVAPDLGSAQRVGQLQVPRRAQGVQVVKVVGVMPWVVG